MKWFTIDFLGETQRGRALLRLALPLMLCFAFLSSALADPPAPGTNRFLFIVDTSSSMKKIADPAREAVFDLIYSGVRGAMTNGDSFGVWLVAAQNDTSGTVETWKSKFAVELAARTALRVKDAPFRGKCALDVALADATRVAQTVGDVTVIIVSNGETPIRGTPFDDAINAQAALLAPEMLKAKVTLNTVLVAQDGQFVAWAMNSPDFLVNMPDVPPKPVKKSPIAKVAPAAVPVPANAPATAPKPRIASRPIIITRETVDREKQAVRAMASIVPASATPEVTNTPAAMPRIAATGTNLTFTVTNAAVTAVPAGTSTVTTAAVTNENPVIAVRPAVSPVLSNANPAAQAAEESHAQSNAAAMHALAIDGNEHPPEDTTPWVWFLGGAGAAVLIALVAFALLRRGRGLEPSLISQAAALERMRR